jgi:hypothetical protein
MEVFRAYWQPCWSDCRVKSCKDFEFIIVNDGSNNSSLEILHEYQVRDPRITIVDQNNIGLTRSLNRPNDIYYWTRITKALDELDIHSTVLLLKKIWL